jgi:hypothetical protein
MELGLALDRNDKDKNGIFSADELTPEIEAALKRYTPTLDGHLRPIPLRR